MRRETVEMHPLSFWKISCLAPIPGEMGRLRQDSRLARTAYIVLYPEIPERFSDENLAMVQIRDQGS